MRAAALLVVVTLATASCVGPDAGHVATAAGGCRSCFMGLPLSLRRIPGRSPEQRRLEKDLTFVDGAGLVWKADVGDVTDGASIPDVFLPITGPRFERHFLPAAVVHDRYTNPEHLVRPWRATARVFYEAMRANRTPLIKAKLMYYAVYAFGTHWGRLSPGQYCGPNCVNLTASQTATLRAAEAPSDRSGDVTQFVFQPETAGPTDVAELLDVRARIVAGERGGRPLDGADLEREAARRHPRNPFLAQGSASPASARLRPRGRPPP